MVGEKNRLAEVIKIGEKREKGRKSDASNVVELQKKLKGPIEAKKLVKNL